MKIYTKTGDSGTTGLFGGPRVLKSDARIAAYGTVDELNATIGFALALLPTDAPTPVDELLGRVQIELFVLGADLATPLEAKVDVPRIEPRHTSALETAIDTLEDELPSLTQFILPGGSPSGASLHKSRTVCRRAERLVVELDQNEAINGETLIYLNRLSDLLFVVSRYVNQMAGQEEKAWSP